MGFGRRRRDALERLVIVVDRRGLERIAADVLLVVSGLLACGCDVIDIGIGTTPTTALMVAHRKAAGGIMITASHNPMPWNGIKFFSADAVAPPKPVVDRILNLFQSRDFKLVPADATGHVSRDDSSIPLHVETVLKTVDADAIRRGRFKVVLDSVNGGTLEGLRDRWGTHEGYAEFLGLDAARQAAVRSNLRFTQP